MFYATSRRQTSGSRIFSPSGVWSISTNSTYSISCLLKRCKIAVAALAFLAVCCGSLHAAELLNINSADAVSIADSLTGIGPAKAQAIVEYREQYGSFVQLEDLTNVPGIGDATLEQIKDLITVDETANQ